jgi:hypothetical protein
MWRRIRSSFSKLGERALRRPTIAIRPLREFLLPEQRAVALIVDRGERELAKHAGDSTAPARRDRGEHLARVPLHSLPRRHGHRRALAGRRSHQCRADDHTRRASSTRPASPDSRASSNVSNATRSSRSRARVLGRRGAWRLPDQSARPSAGTATTVLTTTSSDRLSTSRPGSHRQAARGAFPSLRPVRPPLGSPIHPLPRASRDIRLRPGPLAPVHPREHAERRERAQQPHEPARTKATGSVTRPPPTTSPRRRSTTNTPPAVAAAHGGSAESANSAPTAIAAAPPSPVNS